MEDPSMSRLTRRITPKEISDLIRRQEEREGRVVVGLIHFEATTKYCGFGRGERLEEIFIGAFYDVEEK